MTKWEDAIDEICRQYRIPAEGVDAREVAKLCSAQMEELSGGDSPEDWVAYTFAYLRAEFFPENFRVEKAGQRAEAVCFFKEVMNGLLKRELCELPFDPLRHFALLTQEEEEDCRIREEYRKFLTCYWDGGVYCFMRLADICTPFRTLGHIAGVHHVAMYMARQLMGTEIPVDPGLMSGAALMHDIGKYGCRPEEGRRVPYLHYYYTYQYCQAHGLGMISDIASNHSVWDLELENLSVESLLLIYADFRVKSVYDEEHREHVQFWSLKDSYQVILDKLDNVDEAKRRRYARVYARLQDFEEYLCGLGLKTDLQSARGEAEKENYPVLMSPQQLVRRLKAQAIHSNLIIMEKTTREEEFIELLENIRSQRDSRQTRAYLTAIEEYSAYLPQNQKKTILRFLENMLTHRDGDIRRQSATIAGTLIAGYELCFTKEIPAGYQAPSLGEGLAECLEGFLQDILNPDIQTSEQERRHAGYAMKTMLQTLFAEVDSSRYGQLIDIYRKACRTAADDLNAFFLLDGAVEIRLEWCTDSQADAMKDFALGYISGHGPEAQVAALRLLLVLLRQGYRCRESLPELIGGAIPMMKEQPYCIQYLNGRIREFFGLESDIGIVYYDLTNLYMENQRAEIPWIYKYMNLEILRHRQGAEETTGQRYQYASHLLNMLQFSGRIVNRLQAGQNLVELLPLLPDTQQYEIVLELVRALEIGEYAVSKYIPPFLGQIYHLLDANAQAYVLEELEYQLEVQESRTVLSALETVAAIYKNAEQGLTVEEEERLIGMLCRGMASDRRQISREAFYVTGTELFGENTLSRKQKSRALSLLGRKLLSLSDWDESGMHVYFYGAALNRIYRFISDYQLEYGQLPFTEEEKPAAFFPGTFDPFSLGHKEIVREISRLGYRLYLAVDEFSWSKRTQPYEIRRRILAMSTADLKDVFLFPEEIPVNIATPADMKCLAEALGTDHPYIVAGYDVVLNASAYRKKVEAYSIHSFPHILFTRAQEGENVLPEETKRRIEEKLKAPVTYVRMPALYEEVSSTRVRENVNEGRDISGLVDRGIQNYIYRHGLYSVDSVYKKNASYSPIQAETVENMGGMRMRLSYPDGVRASVSFHLLKPGSLLDECRNMDTADRVRAAISGNAVWIDEIEGSSSELDDRRLTALNEVLEHFQENSYSYALCRPQEEEKSLLALHGFIPVPDCPQIWMVDLHTPLVLFYDLPSLFKDSIGKAEPVRRAIRESHLRLLESISHLYPGRLILCFESEYLNYRLMCMITEENQVSLLPDPDKRLGEKMCVPFGKTLKGVRVPNTVTKELETEKLYTRDMSAFSITSYRGYAPLEIQMRTIRSFDRPVILVDDFCHSGNRLRELMPHLKKEGIDKVQIIVGVLSGRGQDLAQMSGLTIHSVYRVPDLHSWTVESDLYPFMGGDGVETEGQPRENSELCPSINPVLPYATPAFLEGIRQTMRYEFSRVCMENAIRIYQAVEAEYRRQYGRRLTLERISEILLQPRIPDDITITEEILSMTPSAILTQESRKLRRLLNNREVL